MSLASSKDYQFIKFEKSKNKNKKYAAILKNKKTGGEKIINFGAIKDDGTPYEQFKDSTNLKLYSKYDHGDTERQKRYKSRHVGEGTDRRKYSAGWFSWHYLW
jgi:hypothetical protein